MSETNHCPECGADLPTGATEGLCPKCLLAAGLENDSSDTGDSGDSPGSAHAVTTPMSGGFVPPSPQALAAQFPQLEILELLGHGGMGAVYKARQTKLDRLVALKIIRPESADDPAFAERFMREARMLARLSHPNIVAVHDFGEAPKDSGDFRKSRESSAANQSGEGTLYFFIMEYVDGANLRELMQAGAMRPEQALAIVPQICEALQFAHDEGIVHRDVKPENILLDRRGRVKIADFGLAKLAAKSAHDFTLTGTHQVMGTPRYMAPEQMVGSHHVDHRADIYSLGVVFYEMLTGELPMGRFEPPSKKAPVDARLDDVVLRSLDRDPDKRFQQASEVKSQLEVISYESVLSSDSAVSADSAGGLSDPEYRGLSTMAEQKVADLVDWFRGSPDRPTGRTHVSPIASAGIRKQVRGPGIALIALGVLLILASVPVAISLYHSGSPFLAATLALLLAAFVLVGVLALRGGWHMLSLENYRAALLGSFVGQPVGIWGLLVLSRPEVRSAFAFKAESISGFLSKICLNTTLWAFLVSLGGIGGAFLPWGEVFNTAMSPPHPFSAAGFGWWQGMAACFSFAVVVLVLIATAALRPIPLWRPLVIGVAAIAVIAASGSYIIELTNGTLPVQPLLEAASWGISIDGKRPETINDAMVATQMRNGPYVMLGLAVALLLLAALEVRGVFASRSATLTATTDAPSLYPRFSRKAIAGAVWAVYFSLAVGVIPPSGISMQDAREQAPAPPASAPRHPPMSMQDAREQALREQAKENLERTGRALQNDGPDTTGGQAGRTSNADNVTEPSATSPPAATTTRRPASNADNVTEPSAAGSAASQSPGSAGSPNWLLLAVLGLFALPAVLAPFGTTILGMIAVSEIRHSGGKLTGLGLAFADAALFPILLLDAAILGLLFFVFSMPGFTPDPAESDFLAALVTSAVLWAIIDAILLRRWWRAVSRPVGGPGQSSDERHAEEGSPSRASESHAVGGRDWVTLTREQVEHDCLPDFCMVCGEPTRERVSKDFEHQPDWAGVLTVIGIFFGIIPGLIIAALTSTRIRVACPICPRHRGHWKRLVWMASTGWLLLFLLAGVGYLVAMALYPEHGGPQAAGAGIGAVVGLIVYVVPVIYLASTRVTVESITKDEVRFRRVSGQFANAVAGKSENPIPASAQV